MASSFDRIPPLLHDAQLSDCRWDRYLKTLHLSFQCLRRNVDGSPIEDSTVDLKFEGVERIEAHYSPASITVKPSEFEPRFCISLADLEDWRHNAIEAHLAINSPQADFEAATACVRELLVGSLDDCLDDSPLSAHVSFEPRNYGPEGAFIRLCIHCDSLEPYTNGVPLDIETWERQFEAWWTGWKEHWSVKGDDDAAEPTNALEDTFIPAGEPDPPDLSYRPPQAAPFLVTAGTAPAELIKPIEDFHTGIYERGWLIVAAAYPNFDQSPKERADQLRHQYLAWDFGRWVYVRQIDDWWCEGNRACVIARGIEHVIGDGESPAVNKETVITYGLRKYRNEWIIATWSQGWPQYGSADKLEHSQSWKKGWNLAE